LLGPTIGSEHIESRIAYDQLSEIRELPVTPRVENIVRRILRAQGKAQAEIPRPKLVLRRIKN
jgi:hypothetical protein